MLAWLYRILIGNIHSHHWETIRECHVRGNYNNTYYRYILRCTKCGEIKKVDLDRVDQV